jgi:hypothetical protein
MDTGRRNLRPNLKQIFAVIRSRDGVIGIWTVLRARQPRNLGSTSCRSLGFVIISHSVQTLDSSHCTFHCMTHSVSTEVNRPARGADLHVVRGQGVFVVMLPYRVCLPGVHSDNFIFTELWRLLQLRDKWITTQNYFNSKAPSLRRGQWGGRPKPRASTLSCAMYLAHVSFSAKDVKILSCVKNTRTWDKHDKC